MTLLVSRTGIEIEIPELRRVDTDAPRRWLRQGWMDLRQNSLFSIGLGVVFVVLGYIATWLVWQAPWAVMTVTTGFLLMAPVLAIGFYAISCAHEQNVVPGLAQAMGCWRGNGRSVLLYGLILFLVLFAWSRFNWLVTALLMHASGSVFDLSFEQLIGSVRGWTFITLYGLVGLLIAVAVFSGSVITLPLMMDRKIDPVTAVVTSLNAVRMNRSVLARWAVMIFALTALGLATGYLGLVVIFPLLGHASWHAYRDLVVRK